MVAAARDDHGGDGDREYRPDDRAPRQREVAQVSQHVLERVERVTQVVADGGGKHVRGVLDTRRDKGVGVIGQDIGNLPTEVVDGTGASCGQAARAWSPRAGLGSAVGGWLWSVWVLSMTSRRCRWPRRAARSASTSACHLRNRRPASRLR